MFQSAFNQPIDYWDVSSATNMSNVFLMLAIDTWWFLKIASMAMSESIAVGLTM